MPGTGPGTGRILQSNASAKTNARKHIEKHWFGIKERPDPTSTTNPKGKRRQRSNWWPKLHKMEEVMMPGLIMALRLALFEPPQLTTKRAKPLPVDSYWLCAGHHYEIASVLSDWQVTLLISTPSSTFSRRSGQFNAEEDIWITRTGGKNAGETLVDTHKGDVVTVRPR